MKKRSPIILDDDDIYNLTSEEVQFVLNARRVFDYGFGERFDEIIVKKMNLDVGLLLHTEDVSLFDDSVLERFFFEGKRRGVRHLYAIATGYSHNTRNIDSMEVNLYDPPLVGKIESDFRDLSRIRGGKIGIYSGSHYMISACMGFGLLDINGEYTLILGDVDFVKSVVGVGSWDVLDATTDFSPIVLKKLTDAKRAYGYF